MNRYTGRMQGLVVVVGSARPPHPAGVSRNGGIDSNTSAPPNLSIRVPKLGFLLACGTCLGLIVFTCMFLVGCATVGSVEKNVREDVANEVDEQLAGIQLQALSTKPVKPEDLQKLFEDVRCGIRGSILKEPQSCEVEP